MYAINVRGGHDSMFNSSVVLVVPQCAAKLAEIAYFIVIVQLVDCTV